MRLFFIHTALFKSYHKFITGILSDSNTFW